MLQEVLVTAQRRSESNENLPISMEAFPRISSRPPAHGDFGQDGSPRTFGVTFKRTF
jgi:hypothetical protein